MTEQLLSLNDISIVLPSRTNLKYLKWSYQSLRKNIGSDIWICMADDASADNTWDWMIETMKIDPKLKCIQNIGPERLGHTILYDKIVEQLVTTKLFIIAHADMFWLPNSIDNMLKHYKPNHVISATRIEPPLHPTGPEKHLIDMGTEPEEFKEKIVLDFAAHLSVSEKDKTSEGVFAPWLCDKQEFLDIGGHDPLFAPQSKEDSDLWNRMQLNGTKFIQSRDSLVAHLTCRGSRRNTSVSAKNIYEDSPEWLAQNMRSSRNFIRKWGHFVMHDKYMKPIILHLYNIGLVINNCNESLVETLEPWCNTLYVDCNFESYIKKEQPNTLFNLRNRIKDKNCVKSNDIIVSFDAKNLTNQNINLISNLPDIITDSGDIGEFVLDIFSFNIKSLQCHENSLIKVNNSLFNQKSTRKINQ